MGEDAPSGGRLHVKLHRTICASAASSLTCRCLEATAVWCIVLSRHAVIANQYVNATLLRACERGPRRKCFLLETRGTKRLLLAHKEECSRRGCYIHLYIYMILINLEILNLVAGRGVAAAATVWSRRRKKTSRIYCATPLISSFYGFLPPKIEAK